MVGRPAARGALTSSSEATRPSPPGGAAAWVVASSCCALGALYWWGDLTAVGECLTVWPSFVWAVVLGPRLALTWWRGARRPAIFGAVCLLVFVGATTEWRSVFRRAPAPPAPDQPALTRLVTWNVAGGAPWEQAAALRPDVFLLQESGRAPVAGEPLADFQWSATLDPATLTRFPVHRLPSRRIGPWTDPQVLLAFLPGGRRLIVVNVRLVLPAFITSLAAFDLRALGPAHRERVGQFRELASLVRATQAAQSTPSAILAGDFNCPGDARSLDPLREVLRDAWAEAGIGWGGTMPARLPVSRIDQVWVTPDIRVHAARVAPRGASDHRAIVVDLVLP